MAGAKLIELVTVTVGLVLTLIHQPQQSTWFSCRASLLFELMLSLYIDSQFYGSSTYPIWFRHKDAGLWCCLMVPCLLCSQAPLLSQMLVMVSFLVYMWMFYSSWQAGWTAVCLVATYTGCRVGYLAYSSQDVGDGSLVLHLLALGLYCTLLIKVPRHFPASFTYGEAAMTCQLYTVTVFMCVKAVQNFQAVEDRIRLGMVVFCGVHVFVAIVLLSWQLGLPALAVWGMLVVCGLSAALVTLHFVVNFTELQIWMFSKKSVAMLSWWTGLTFSSILVVALLGNVSCAATTSFTERDEPNKHIDEFDKLPETMQCVSDQHSETLYYKEIVKPVSSRAFKGPAPACHGKDGSCGNYTSFTQVHASTMARKYFHLMLLLVYVPGLVYTPHLLYVASTAAAGLLFITEFVRYLQLPPIGKLLNSHMTVFVDRQDRGEVILTPLYLIVGCSLPLWFLPHTVEAAHVSLFSGLLSIGVGDSAASVVGRALGAHKWPDSHKTLEGTAASIVFQLLAVSCLALIGVTNAWFSLPVLFTIVCNAVLESCTEQIDNLVVPVFTFMTMTRL